MRVVGLHDEGVVAGGDFAVDASMMAPPAGTDVGGRKYAGGSLLPRSSSGDSTMKLAVVALSSFM